jgi:glycosyltransferase involved in cell wall biosynthesis
MRISIVVAAWDSERITLRCLDSLGWADEIIAVDSGANPGNAAAAEKNGARLYKRKWNGSADRKNFGISKAKGEWVLSLDADDIVTWELREEIEGIVEKPERVTRNAEVRPQIDNRQPTTGNREISAYCIPQRMFVYGREMRFGGVSAGRICLFKKSNAGVKGKTGRIKSPLLHYSNSFVRDHINARNDDTGSGPLRPVPPGYRPTAYSVLIKPALNFIKSYFFRLGFLDGFSGLIHHTIEAQFCFAGEIKTMQALGMGWADLFKKSSKL